MAIRFGVSSTVKNRLPRYSNFWDGTAVYSPFSPTGSYDALATYTVPSGGVSTVTFSGLPTNGQYTHLQIRANVRGTVSDVNDAAYLKFNSDGGSNYATHYLSGDGSSASAYYGSSMAPGYPMYMLFFPGANASASQFGSGVIDILDFASTLKTKVVRSLTGSDRNGAGRIYFSSALWNSTAAINSITFNAMNGNFAQYSEFSVYGVRG